MIRPASESTVLMGWQEMNQTDAIDTCLRQAQLAYQMHNDRRQWEWKFSLGLWAVILTTIVEKVPVCPWIWIGLVFVYGFFWLRPIWIANENNKVWYEHFMKEADALRRNPTHPIEKAPEKLKLTGVKKYVGFLSCKAWSMLFRLLTTAMLAFIAYSRGT